MCKQADVSTCLEKVLNGFYVFHALKVSDTMDAVDGNRASKVNSEAIAECGELHRGPWTERRITGEL